MNVQKNAQEFIGKTLKIIKSNNSTLVDIEGIIVDETKFTFVLLTKSKEKRIMKKNTVFKIGNDEIIGNAITKRPEERVKLRG